MKIITIEEARKILKKGECVTTIPSVFSSPDGKKCDSALMIYDRKFFVLTVVELPNNIALMKAGHIELTTSEAKELFGHQVDFFDIEVPTKKEEPKNISINNGISGLYNKEKEKFNSDLGFFFN